MSRNNNLSTEFIAQAYQKYVCYLQKNGIILSPEAPITNPDEFTNILNELNKLDDFPLCAIFADNCFTQADQSRKRAELCTLINELIPLSQLKDKTFSFKKFDPENAAFKRYLQTEEALIEAQQKATKSLLQSHLSLKDQFLYSRNLNARGLFDIADGHHILQTLGFRQIISITSMDSLDAALLHAKKEAVGDDLSYTLRILINNSCIKSVAPGEFYTAKPSGSHYTALIASVTPKNRPCPLHILTKFPDEPFIDYQNSYILIKQANELYYIDTDTYEQVFIRNFDDFNQNIQTLLPEKEEKQTAAKVTIRLSAEQINAWITLNGRHAHQNFVFLEYFDSGTPNPAILQTLSNAVTSYHSETKIQAFPTRTQVRSEIIRHNHRQTNGYSCFDLALNYLLKSLNPRIMPTLNETQLNQFAWLIPDEKLHQAHFETALRIACFTILLAEYANKPDYMSVLKGSRDEIVQGIYHNLLKISRSSQAVTLTPSPAAVATRAPATPTPSAAAASPALAPLPTTFTQSQPVMPHQTPPMTPPKTQAGPPFTAPSSPYRAAAATSTLSTTSASAPATPQPKSSQTAAPMASVHATLIKGPDMESDDPLSEAIDCKYVKEQIEIYRVEPDITDTGNATCTTFEEKLQHIFKQGNLINDLFQALAVAENDAVHKDIQYNAQKTIGRCTKGSRFQKTLQTIRHKMMSNQKTLPENVLHTECTSILELFTLTLRPQLGVEGRVDPSLYTKFNQWLTEYQAPNGGIKFKLLIELNALLEEVVSTRKKTPIWLINACQNLSIRLMENITAQFILVPPTDVDGDLRWQQLTAFAKKQIAKCTEDQARCMNELTVFLSQKADQTYIKKCQLFLELLTKISRALIRADQIKSKSAFTFFGLGHPSIAESMAAQEILAAIRDQANDLFLHKSHDLYAAEALHVIDIASFLFAEIKTINPAITTASDDLSAFLQKDALLPTQYYNLMKFSALLFEWCRDKKSIFSRNPRLLDIVQQLQNVNDRVLTLRLKLLDRKDSGYILGLIRLATKLHEPKDIAVDPDLTKIDLTKIDLVDPVTGELSQKLQKQTQSKSLSEKEQSYLKKLITLLKLVAIESAKNKDSFKINKITLDQEFKQSLGVEIGTMHIFYNCDEQTYQLTINNCYNRKKETFCLTHAAQPKAETTSTPRPPGP